MERKRKLEINGSTSTEKRRENVEGEAAAENSSINPYTGRPYSKRYFEILDGRKGVFML